MNAFKSYFVPKKAASDKARPAAREKEAAAATAQASGSNGNNSSGGRDATTTTTTTMTTAAAGLGAPGPTPASGPTSLGGTSRPDSLRSSNLLYPAGDFRNDAESASDVRAEVVCNYMYQRQLERGYATGLSPAEGVVLKKGKNDYTCCPPDLRQFQYGLYDMTMELNVRVCVVVCFCLRFLFHLLPFYSPRKTNHAHRGRTPPPLPS